LKIFISLNFRENNVSTYHKISGHNLQWGSILCLVPIKASRWQLWKGKQNKNSEEKKIERKSNVVKLIIIKMQNTFIFSKIDMF
jgi:hypothetical protein